MSRIHLKNLFHHVKEKINLLSASSISIEDALEMILMNFYQRMSQDILLGFFFHDKDLKKIVHMQRDFLLFAAGLKSSYSGKTPTSAHLQMPPILEGHFNRRLVILQETLESYKLDDKDIRSWIEFENAFREVVVQK